MADTGNGNGRIQKFDLPTQGFFEITPGNVSYTLSTGLSSPAAVAAVDNLTNDLFYVADTGHDQIILCNVPGESPDVLQAVWNSMTTNIAAGDISGALSYFSIESADDYRQTFLSVGTANTISAISQIGALTPVYIYSDEAEYYFTNTVDRQNITFPVKFDKENGVWKILEF